MSGHDTRCQQVAEAISLRGNSLQVLTSNHRVPPGGIASDRGVFRELALSADFSEDGLRALSYHDVRTLEMKNAATLDYRINRFKPDVVLVWNCKLLSRSLLKRMEDHGVAVVYDLHNEWALRSVYESDPWQWWWHKKNTLGAKLHKLLLTVTGARRRVTRKLPICSANELDFSNSWVCSRALQQTLQSDGLSGIEDRPVIYPAVTLPSKTVKTSFQHRNRFMWAGRLSEGKGPDIALDAMSTLKDLGVQCHLDVFGMGEPIQRKTIRERINQMGLADYVTIVAIRPGEITKHYANYDAYISSSRCDDPFSITTLEAMQSGLPCILSQDGGAPEIVEDGETAFIYERDNHEALMYAIQRFMALKDAGEALAAKCMRVLEERYSMDKYIDQVESMFPPEETINKTH
ncbi:MAG: glycosyltransferase family 4 protein [Opitutaceae bacterium]